MDYWQRSITSDCITLSGALSKATSGLNGFVREIREARASIDGLSREAHSFHCVLDMLKEDAGLFPSELAVQTALVLEHVAKAIDQFDGDFSTLSDANSPRNEKKRRWTETGKLECSRFKETLEAHHSILGLAMDLVVATTPNNDNSRDSASVRRYTEYRNQNGTAVKEDVARILDETLDLRERLPGEFEKRDSSYSSFTLHDYINALETHATTLSSMQQYEREADTSIAFVGRQGPYGGDPTDSTYLDNDPDSAIELDDEQNSLKMPSTHDGEPSTKPSTPIEESLPLLKPREEPSVVPTPREETPQPPEAHQDISPTVVGEASPELPTPEEQRLQRINRAHGELSPTIDALINAFGGIPSEPPTPPPRNSRRLRALPAEPVPDVPPIPEQQPPPVHDLPSVPSPSPVPVLTPATPEFVDLRAEIAAGRLETARPPDNNSISSVSDRNNSNNMAQQAPAPSPQPRPAPAPPLGPLGDHGYHNFTEGPQPIPTLTINAAVPPINPVPPKAKRLNKVGRIKSVQRDGRPIEDVEYQFQNHGPNNSHFHYPPNTLSPLTHSPGHVSNHSPSNSISSNNLSSHSLSNSNSSNDLTVSSSSTPPPEYGSIPLPPAPARDLRSYWSASSLGSMATTQQTPTNPALSPTSITSGGAAMFRQGKRLSVSLSKRLPPIFNPPANLTRGDIGIGNFPLGPLGFGTTGGSGSGGGNEEKKTIPATPAQTTTTITTANGVFGVPLQKSIKQAKGTSKTHHSGGGGSSKRDFPLCMQKCCFYLQQKGTTAPDIFANPGDAYRVAKLREVFSTAPVYGEHLNFVTGGGAAGIRYDAYDTADLVLLFLTELPTPLVPESAAKRWIAMSRQHTMPSALAMRGPDQCIDFWEEALGPLKGPARSLFKLLLNLWADVAAQEHVNDMTAERLAGCVIRPLMHNIQSKYHSDYMLALGFLIRKRAEYQDMLRRDKKDPIRRIERVAAW